MTSSIMKDIYLFQLMSQQYLSNRKNVVHYPYFRRNDTIDVKLDSYKIPRHRYTLLGIARNDTYGTDIFLHYFQSYYTKQYERNNARNTDRLQRTQVSQFFWIFIKIKALRNLVSIDRNITGLIGMALSEIFSLATSESEKKLVSLIKNEVSQMYQEQSDRILKIKKEQYVEIAMYIENKIDSLLSDFYQKIKRPQFFQHLKQTQFLQEQLNDNQKMHFIRKNLESIRNLQIYCKSIKKDIWQQFYNIHKGYMTLRIPLIMDSQRTVDNTITLPKYTQEADYIMTKMLAYLNFKISEQKLAAFHSSSLQLIKQITQICSNYYKQTNKYYPSLSLDCIFFDQKKLVPVLSYSPILQEAIGIKRNTKNLQLMIVTEPTPFFNIEQSYLQTIKQYKILSNRKYYSPITRQKGEDLEGYTQNMKRQENFMQKTHVWRLLQIIYYVQNHRYFTNDYYNQRFSKSNVKGNHAQLPFYYDQYKTMLKKAFEGLQQGKLTIQQIISIKPTPKNTNSEPQGSQNSSKFTFDFDSIKTYLNILDEDDSLLQSLKFQKTKNLISERFMLMKEFNILVLHPQFFKKMINPKKYYLIYFLHCYDEAFLKKIIRDKEKEIIQKELAQMEQLKSKKIRQQEDFYNFLYFGKKELIEQLQKYIFKASLSKEIQKRKMLKNDTQKKLSEYHGRKDISGDYVRKQIEFYNSIFEIKSIFSLIQLYQSIQKNATLHQNSFQVLNYFLTLNTEPFQADQRLKQYIFQCKNINQEQKSKGSLNRQAQEVCIEIYKHINDKIETNISTLLEKLKNVVIKFITNEILEDFKIPQKLHDLSSNIKSDKQTWSAICNYKNTRFKVLIESLYYLDESLLMNYKSYSNFLIEEPGGLEQKAKKMQPSEIISMTNNILLFRKKILKLKSPGFIV